MSSLSVKLAKAYLRLAPVAPSPDYLPLDRLTVETGLKRAEGEYLDERAGGFLKLFEVTGDAAFPGRGGTFLDLGCGFGGRTVAFQERFGGTGIGLEVDERVVACARRFAEARHAGGLSFVVGFGERLPFPDESFDAVFSYDVLEHVRDPLRCLRECRRVLKPGGRAFLVFPPFFHPTGAHLEGYVSHMPYANLVFPPKILMKAIDEILADRGGAFRPQPLQPGHILYSLNGLTVSGFEEILKESGFKTRSVTLLPLFSRANRRYADWKMKYYAWIFRWLTRVPLLREAFTHRIVATLVKD